jgi:hypothetical protein
MPKQIKHAKKRTNATQIAPHLVTVSTQEDLYTIPATKEQISLLMAAMGRKGGKIGGKRRLETMSPKQRTTIARNAARARWRKKDSNC